MRIYRHHALDCTDWREDRSELWARRITLYFLLPLMLLGALAQGGCQTLQQPETPSQGIAAAYVTVETLADLALAMHETGAISDADRADAREQLQRALDVLAAAEAGIAEGDASGTESALDTVNSIIRQVRAVISVSDGDST
jgi:hypothetical protein